MGFYGNITNTSNTTFQFDRIYPNRLAMDANVNNDGIFIGRYVLVEYDQDAAYPIIYTKNGNFYSSPNFEDTTRIKFKQGVRPSSETQSSDVFYHGEIGQVQDLEYDNQGNLIKVNSIKFYQCSNLDEEEKIYATFELLTQTTSNNKYIQNFAIDEAQYPNEKFKGYDSTVWTKVSVTDSNNKLITKYVNVADLNSVVPTFDITADAPTMTPITPHFDADSTNVYYKLHAQPQWGFRVAQTDENKSNEKTQWTREFYDANQDISEIKYASGVNNNGIPTWTNNPESTLNAAIYYNSEAFDPQINSNSIKKHSETVKNNEIKIMPTGKSGIEYNNHNGSQSPSKSAQIDTQELTINLPAIGNMMSDAWDIIHGKQRNDYRGDGENASLQGRLDAFEGIEINQIPIKRNDGTIIGSKINNGVKFDYQENNSKEILDESIATIPQGEKSLAHDDPWIRVNIDTTNLEGGTKVGDNPSQANNNGVLIQHTFHATQDSETTLNKNDGSVSVNQRQYNYLPYIEKKEGEETVTITSINAIENNTNDTIKLYTPYVDATGHVVGKNIETVTLPYGYKTITTNGRGLDTTDANDSSMNPQPNVVADNTQDSLALNSGNKWIRIDTDEANDIITFSHDVHNFNTDSNGHTNLNTESSAAQEDNLTIYDWAYDNAGHITEKRAHTYTLPFGFKSIKTNGRSTEVSENATTNPTTTNVIADNTQDELTINSGNKWIRIDTDATNDSLTIRHDVHSISITSNTTNWNETENDTTIPVTTYSFDEAGHYKSHHTESYMLPYGYGKIKGDSGSTSASATFDELSVLSGDDWIATVVDTDRVAITHTGPVAKEARNESHKTPKFGETFEIEDWVFDDKGHKTNVSKHTVTIPRGSLNDLTATSSSVLTGIKMNVETGDITQSNANVGTLALTGFVDDTDTNGKTLQITSSNSINTAFKTVQNYINNLDYNNEDNTKIISKITQTDGKVAVERATAGTLQLGTASTDGTIPATSSLNHAFNITNARIKAEEDALTKEVKDRQDAITKEVSDRNTAIANAIAEIVDKNDDGTVNKLAEVIEWINNNPSTATQMQKAIQDNAKNIELEASASRSNEQSLQTNINNEQNRAQQAEQALQTQINSFGTASQQDVEYFATANQGQKADTAIQPDTKFIYVEEFKDSETGDIIIEEVKMTIEQLVKKVAELENEIKILKDK